MTVPDIRNYMRDTHSFTSLGGYQGAGFELSGVGEPAMVNATRMSGGVCRRLGCNRCWGASSRKRRTTSISRWRC